MAATLGSNANETTFEKVNKEKVFTAMSIVLQTEAVTKESTFPCIHTKRVSIHQNTIKLY